MLILPPIWVLNYSLSENRITAFFAEALLDPAEPEWDQRGQSEWAAPGTGC